MVSQFDACGTDVTIQIQDKTKEMKAKFLGSDQYDPGKTEPSGSISRGRAH